MLDTLLGKLHKVKRSGEYWTALCPNHDDQQNSLSVKVQDDGKITVQCYAGCEVKDVLARIDMTLAMLYPDYGERAKRKRQRARMVKTYDYVDILGNLIYQVVRMEPKGFRQRRPDPGHDGQWIWNLKGVDPVLYNMPSVVRAFEEGRKVFLVEGEKDADALTAMGLRATTNSGGAEKWRDSFTECLNQGAVVILPDNDETGKRHAEKVHAKLNESVILELPGLGPKGDVSDWIAAGGTKADLVRLARDAWRRADEEPPTAPPETRSPSASSNGATGLPFRPLGYDSDRFYVFSHRTQQVLGLSTAALNQKTTFSKIAPPDFWELTFDDTGAAADYIIQVCIDAGVFRPDIVRGRGAWMEGGDVVLHHGDHLTVNGERDELVGHASGYVYERALTLRIPHTAANRAEDGQRLADLCTSLNWEDPLAGMLLAGWLAIAPICGAMAWRPHIWVTGPSGTGKTWVVDNIIGALLGDIALKVQSVTTEAGIRQLLKRDALPIVFDEAETDDQRGQANIQRVLELARQASSESGSIIAKGTADGRATTFQIRSAFCMSSISVGVHRRADETRVTTLSLRPPEKGEAGKKHFEQVKKEAARVCNEDYAAGMVARSCSMAGTIRKNADTFAIAVGQAMQSRRLGDQIGALLAGYWSLWSDDTIALDAAVEYVGGLDLRGLVPEDEGADELRCLGHITEQTITVELDRARVTRSIGELLEDVIAPPNDTDAVPARTAEKVLRRHGIRTEGSMGFLVATKHSGVAKMLGGTPWAVNWSAFLRRVPGATSPRAIYRFAGGPPSRAVLIPWAAMGVGLDLAEPVNRSVTDAVNEEYLEDETLF